MASPEMVQILAMVFGAVCVGIIIYVFVYPYLSGETRTEKRVANVTEGHSKRNARKVQSAVEQTANARRKQVSQTIKDLEERQKQREKINMRLRLERAGLEHVKPESFYVGCAIGAVGIAAMAWIAGSSLPVVLAAGLTAALGLPRWILAKLTKRRQRKFVDEFANSIDVIVRGVKSGLPLNECLGIIAREAPEPIRGEFAYLVEQQRVGVTLQDCFERMMQRIPLPEVKFFAIVLGIQQQAGGNLSEALGNLAGVLRDRKRLEAKVKALSAEAKASAMILASLPFAVILLIYLSTPEYISLLWTERTGHFLLAGSAVWMSIGVLVMRKMINFKY